MSDANRHNTVKYMTYLMFFAFAMTTDAVGVIIPQVVKEFDLSLTQAGAFHYVTMVTIAVGGIGLGSLADTWGRKPVILVGLGLFAVACYGFMLSQYFWMFLCLLAMMGLAIGLFKTGALALIGDISQDSHAHTRTMNAVEGFFGVGAIVGPAVVTYLVATGAHWSQLYLLAGALCSVLLIVAWRVRYPEYVRHEQNAASFKSTIRLVNNPYALGFSMAIALYVAIEVAIFVWMPTLLADYVGQFEWLATYALTIFFVLRTAGRFMAVWILARFCWTAVICVFTGLIFLCYLGAMVFGTEAAIFLLPLSGLFMSMIYPTLNSKGISCFARQQHGSVAGLILFFTAVSAALAPLLMGLIGDAFGHVRYGFILATILSACLFAGMLYNWLKQPARDRLAQLQAS
ncbi:sugar MFS transporter [Bowmanella sp. JS7-9]|uniref:MFS transporter n=1 Tax=Pseudobowmanella zhangzhouensis TaxID=1537679 RepID=A0ABW1XMI6_9ALTE|nr:MFS transporter [Bowmanella sp. JS7-9]TBX21868.1 MFS transporter [Bowmanella sp. JS7-9]